MRINYTTDSNGNPNFITGMFNSQTTSGAPKATYVPPKTSAGGAKNAKTNPLSGMFAKTKAYANGMFPNARSEFSNLFSGNGALAPGAFDWSSSSGLKAFNRNLGTGANIISGIGQGVGALQGLSNYNDSLEYNEDVINDILMSVMSNPIHSSYLTSEQLALLNKLRKDNYDTSSDFSDFLGGVGSGLGNTAMSALGGFAIGGIPGAVINGVGSLVNSGIKGLSSGTEEESAELAALYQALQDAEAQYRSMKRPNFTGLGIQQQYQNMYA